MWFPPTPEKQVVQNAHSENHESHQARGEDWGNLLGVYSEMLQNDMPNTVLGNDYDVTPGKQFNMLQLNPEPGGVMLSSNDGLWIKDAAHSSVQQQHRLPWEDNPINSTGLCNPQQESNQELGMLQQCVRRNQGVVAAGSSLGQIPQQKVRSLAELMASSGARPGQFLNGDPVVRSQAHIQIDQVARAIARTEVHPGPNLNAQHASYHRQGMTSSSHSSSYPGDHNLNLRTSLGGETSTIPVSQPLGPVTPDVQRQARNITPQIIPWGCVRETSEQNNVLLMKQVPVSQALRPATTEVQGQPQNATQVPQLITLGCTQESHEQAKQTEVLKQQDGMLANVGSTNTAFSNSDEKNNLHNGSEGIDLNRTPQQKPPKRKKYLPKVVVEGKLKRTPKSAAVKTTTPGGNSPAKRSYVRKNGIKTSLSGTEDVEPADMGLVKKSCRRALNFDLDETTKKQQKDEKSNTQAENTDGGLQQPFNLNEVQNTAGSEIQQRTTAIANSASKISVQDLGNTAEKPRARDISLNEIARSFNTQSNLINQCSSNSTSNQVHQAMGAGLAQQLYLLANANKAKMNDEGRPWLQGMAQNQNDVLIGVENHCLKKPYASSGLRKPQTTSFMGPELGLPGYPEVRPCNTYIPWHDDSDVGKKRHLDGNFHETSSSHHYEHLLQVERQVRNNLRAHSSFVGNNDGLNPTYQSRKAFPDVPQHSYNRSYMSSGELYLQQRKQQMLQQISMSKNTNPGELTKWNPGAAVGSPDRVAVRKRTAGEISSKKLSPNVIHEKRSTNSRSYGSSLKGKGSKKQREPLTADDLVDCLKRLDLNSNNSKNDEYALVPYGANGAIVPHEGIDPAKRRFPRPKVDLDLETNRLWNLLMGKEGSGSAEMDKDKQKWWEEERRVFRGRIDSFIARMHLVQGDRRFSKWKGSVVDSVVGVFLTQNVSDHLSSSAFMCLAAKFPRKMKNSSQSRQAAEDSSSANHNDIHITFPDQTTTDHKTDGELTYNQSSVTTVESMGSYVVRTEDDVISSQSSSGSLIFTASKDVRSSSGSNSEAEEGCIISGNLLHENAERAALVQQDTFQSKESLLPNKTPLIVENHQLEDTVYGQSAKHANIRNEILNPFVSKGPHDQATFLQSTNTWQCMQMDLEKWDADFLTVPEKQSSSSLASATFEARDEVITEGSNTNRMLHTEGTSVAIVSGTQELNPLQEDSDIQRSINQRSEDEDFQLRKTRKQQAVPLEERLQMNPISQDVAENLKSKGNMISEQAKKKPPTDGSQPYLLTKQPNKSNSVPSKPASQKTEKMKEAFNWDTLRKQAELKYGTKERSWEAMDSLDYEALRNASVHVISDTIKERGMNNMLAERIKDFLDRLVQDHGRVDLEWLRDVPPDKVKDYLLSIRGLGLKSVECVRLLTLHNLAFPVDTNVGRIAVRLGWVPLQPLPESLQLHLLELYPVLETIQKYLWPRLCNLDQETLYELHYQMITFGKVFCTKRDPNCNACPMRGECRHFASAFASARLALPGPQERQLVNSSHSHPTVSNNVPEKTTNPLLLPSSVENIEQKSETPKICEPVIEEPTTPELPHADLERDIEDAFYNDPDEIPVIELNVKEFASNLQSFMQENMEIAEADMSKALVALSPELASIPAPKLKHVSRLRTEHQVYELPDSHPLLERMDVREADDPSPYLLAIWSPGETADSFQPPESKCRSQELGELCFDSTCFACNSKKEAQALTVRGTILIPCRTAMRGSFPLNGTYFQVNEVFADHASSLKPIDVPRSLIWKLPRRTVFFGTSVSTIFKGLSTEAIQHCFWRGFVCVRGFDQQSRAPRPLMARLHFPDHSIFTFICFPSTPLSFLFR